MSKISRIFKVLNVAAKYRLVDFFSGVEQAALAKLLLRVYGAPWRLGTTVHSKEQRLKLALEELGPIYIKFGQLLSTRRDFLDDALADALQSLQDDVPPFAEPTIERRIATELGREWNEIFASLDSTPLASASIAQVHSATLHDGEEVVVKVTRPGIEKTIAADIRLLKWVAAFVEGNTGIGKRLRPVEVVNDYEKIIFDELNLQAEAANTSQLRRNFENSDLLYVPRVYWDLCSQNLMVMERIYGIPVADIDALVANGTNLKVLAERGVEIFFTQVFEHSFFHADMHPGNIFVDPENPQEPKYIAIDCAIIGSLSKGDQQYLARNLLAIFQRDYRKVAELHIECGWVPAQTKVHEFESAIRTVCEPIFEKPLKDISFAHLLMQLFRTAGRFDMEVQPSLVLLQKTLLNVEGLGRQLYPELDLWQTALPFLERWNTKRLNPFTLLSRIQENVPDWVDQLPDLPKLLIESFGDAKELAAVNESLRQQRLFALQEAQARRQGWRRSAYLLLGLAVLYAVPQSSAMLQTLPPVSVGFGVIALVFLSFRR